MKQDRFNFEDGNKTAQLFNQLNTLNKPNGRLQFARHFQITRQILFDKGHDDLLEDNTLFEIESHLADNLTIPEDVLYRYASFVNNLMKDIRLPIPNVDDNPDTLKLANRLNRLYNRYLVDDYDMEFDYFVWNNNVAAANLGLEDFVFNHTVIEVITRLNDRLPISNDLMHRYATLVYSLKSSSDKL